MGWMHLHGLNTHKRVQRFSEQNPVIKAREMRICIFTKKDQKSMSNDHGNKKKNQNLKA